MRGLVADIGATNARFALVDAAGEVVRPRILACEDYRAIDDAIDDYLRSERVERPRAAALAIASPVTGDHVALTNNPWQFSISELRRRLGLERLEVVNDFTANALALPRLSERDRRQVGGGHSVAGAAMAVLGPGSGLGVSGLIPSGRRWIPLAGEGGHATMPASSDREAAVLALMRHRFDHVSAERVLSGPGLVNLYAALTELDGVPAASYTPAQITDPATRASDRHCREATEMFCAMLGTVAGNLALTLGARGGVYIAGGIVPKLGPMFDTSEFRARFEAKGRFRSYLADIPTYVVTNPVPAFLGLAGLLG
ncbi:MAG: glucokinase [Rhodospirillales bacterium]|nr:glucokinase [Rhodospirillales bacterium]